MAEASGRPGGGVAAGGGEGVPTVSRQGTLNKMSGAERETERYASSLKDLLRDLAMLAQTLAEDGGGEGVDSVGTGPLAAGGRTWGLKDAPPPAAPPPPPPSPPSPPCADPPLPPPHRS